jgi:hypothetical protein
MPPRRIRARRPNPRSSGPENGGRPRTPPPGRRSRLSARATLHALSVGEVAPIRARPSGEGPPGRGDPSEPGRALAGVGPAAARRQARHRVSSAFPAPASARANAHQPVQVVTAVRATIRPAAVQRAEHPLLLTVGQSHGYLPPLPVSTRSPPLQALCCALSAGRLGQRTPPICAGKSQLIVCGLQNFIRVHQRTLYTLCLQSDPRIVLAIRPIAQAPPSSMSSTPPGLKWLRMSGNPLPLQTYKSGFTQSVKLEKLRWPTAVNRQTPPNQLGPPLSASS